MNLFKNQIRYFDSSVKDLSEYVDFKLLNPYEKFKHEI